MSKAKTRSISMKLSAIARNRNVPFEQVLTEFLLERMVARLVKSEELCSSFIYKGGYVGRRVYGSPRYTIDLDALLKKGQPRNSEDKIKRVIERDIGDGVWFRLEKTQDLQTQGEYPGTRFVFRAGLGDIPVSIKRSQIVEFDIGSGDFVLSKSVSLSPLLGEEAVTWEVYSAEVTVAEKLHSFLSKPVGNSRSKDLYDLLFYLPKCDPKTLTKAVQGTFKTRKMDMPERIAQAFADIRTDALKRGWKSAITHVDESLSFDEVFFQVTSLLKTKLD